MNVNKKDTQQDEYVRRLLLELLRSLISDQEPVAVDLSPEENYSTLKVTASAAAIAVLIGPKGQMARSLRTIIAGAGAKTGRRYSLDLCDTAGPTK